MTWIAAFDAVRIINVPRRTDRRCETEAEFARHGLPLHTERVRFFEAVTPTEAAGFASIGTHGCFMSHLGVLEEAQGAGARAVLVLEDDVQFTRHLGALAPAAVRALDAMDWDLAYLGHAQQPPADARGWQPVTSPMLLAHCYAVNGRTLPALTAYLRAMLARPPGDTAGGPMHYDGALNWFVQAHPEVRAWFHAPNLAYQRPSATDLHTRTVLDESALLRPLTAVLRRVKRGWLRRTR